ncbi:MAG: hypothetical protein ACLFTK_12365 [Anaerolineales bacterium]
MAYDVYWIQEPHLISADYSGPVSVDDLDAVIAFCLPAADNNPVYFLIDMHASTSWPANILKLASLNRLLDHPNTRWFALVGHNPFLKFVIQLSRRSTKVKFFEVRADAVEFLQERVTEEINYDSH